MKKIILTGGGTAGHVMPNIALLPYLTDYEIHYVGSKNGIEKELLKDYPQVIWHEIRTGKLRRYFSLKNFTDIFNVIGGRRDAGKIVKEVKPDVVFSKGGFVSVPVVLAAKSKKVPVITHESDMTPGLANKIIARSADKVLTTFPETAPMIRKGKGQYIGSPIRQSLFEGKREKGLEFLGFSGKKPIVSVMGGSLGSKNVNAAVRDNLGFLCEKFDVCHMCGKGNLDDSEAVRKHGDSYRQYEFISGELADVLAATDFMVSRAGSNAISEFAALNIPMLLIPLSKNASRGDQVLNAESFAKRGFAVKLEEEELTAESFRAAVERLEREKDDFVRNLREANFANGTKLVFEAIEASLKK